MEVGYCSYTIADKLIKKQKKKLSKRLRKLRGKQEERKEKTRRTGNKVKRASSHRA